MRTAPVAGSGSGKRRSSRCPGAVITAARTVPLTVFGTLQGYRSSVQLPAMIRVVGDEPSAVRPRHHVEVVQVIARTRRDGVVSARDEDHVAVADLDGLVERAVVGIDKLHGK